MTRAAHDVLASIRVLVVTTFGLTLAVVLEPLLAAETTGLNGTALVLLVVSSLVPLGHRWSGMRVSRASAVRRTAPADEAALPVQLATDPSHHPLCPRAPGIA